MVSFEAFLEWVLIVEPTLKLEDIQPLIEDIPEPIFSEYTLSLLESSYKDALCRCKGIKNYMRECNYESCVYNYALHIAIMTATFNNTDEVTDPLQKVKLKYITSNTTVGLLTSASSGGSSASTTLPKIVSEGDMETAYLLSTPYGIQVEMYFESLGGCIII